MSDIADNIKPKINNLKKIKLLEAKLQSLKNFQYTFNIYIISIIFMIYLFLLTLQFKC